MAEELLEAAQERLIMTEELSEAARERLEIVKEGFAVATRGGG